MYDTLILSVSEEKRWQTQSQQSELDKDLRKSAVVLQVRHFLVRQGGCYAVAMVL